MLQYLRALKIITILCIFTVMCIFMVHQSNAATLATGKLTSMKSTSSKTIQLRWRKDTSISGYQIWISKSSSFNKDTRSKRYGKNITGVTVEGFPSGKKYYGKMRKYILKNNKYTYSKWSNVKSVVVK
ncbi:MAG: hypothetical protein MRZ63_02830 [Anaerostipes sp.]|nr:hypothetical protein [Anaerostipes sp.]